MNCSITLLAVLLLIIALNGAVYGILSWLAWSTVQESTEETVSLLQQSISERIKNQFLDSMSTPATILSHTAMLVHSGWLNLFDPTAVSFEMYKHLTIWPYSAHYIGVDNNSAFYGYFSLNNTHYTARIKNLTNGPLRTVYVVGKDTPFDWSVQNLFQAPAVFNTTQRPWYVQQRANIKIPVQFSSVYPFILDGTLGTTATAPLFTPTGDFVGVAGIDLTLRFLSDILVKALVGRRTVLFVAEESGDLIAASHGSSGAPNNRLQAVQSSNKLIRDVAAKIDFKSSIIDLGKSQQLDMSEITIDGSKYWITVANVNILNLQWCLVTVLATEDFMGLVEQTGTRLIIIVVVVSVCVLIISASVALGVSRSLRALESDMQAVGVMELENINTKHRTGSWLKEVASMQACFLRMVDNLIEYKAFLPQGIMVDEDMLSEADLQNLMSFDEFCVAAPGISPRSHQGSHEHSLASANITDPVSLNSRAGAESPIMMPQSPASLRRRSTIRETTSEQTNDNNSKGGTPDGISLAGKNSKEDLRIARLRDPGFKNYISSFVVVGIEPDLEHLLHTNITLPTYLQSFVNKAINIINQHQGVVTSVRAKEIVATWNTFRPCATHEVIACRCALALRDEFAGDEVHVVASMGPISVGYMGAFNSKSVVIVGEVLENARTLLWLSPNTGTSVTVTEPIARRIATQFTVYPIDVVMFKNGRTQLYELAGERKEICDSDLVCDAYLAAYSRFTVGSWDAAIDNFKYFIEQYPEGQQLAQILRLSKLCFRFKEGGKQGTYSRRFIGWENYEFQLSSVILPHEFDAVEEQVNQLAATKVIKYIAGGEDESTAFTSTAYSYRSGTPEAALSSDMASPRQEAAIDVGGVNLMPSGKVLFSNNTYEVRIGMQDDGSIVAMKFIDLANALNKRKKLSKESADDILDDMTQLVHLRNDFVVGYVGATLWKNYLVVASEYVVGSSLASTLENFTKIPAASVKRYTRDILNGLSFLHNNSVVHRDLKPAHVFLMNDGRCKLSDFGALVLLQKDIIDVAGTPGYIAPEAVAGLIVPANDIWSLGIIVKELLTGRSPKIGNSVDSHRGSILRKLESDLSMITTIPEDEVTAVAADFIRKCLVRDPANRATASQLLSHEFVDV